MQTIVTFQPGGTDQGTSVFTTFSALCTFITTSPDSAITRWTIQIDASSPSAAGNAIIPAGTYPLPASVDFVGLDAAATNYPILTCSPDVVFNPIPAALTFSNLPFVQLQNTSHPLILVDGNVATSAEFIIEVTNCNLVGSNSAAPFVSVTNGGQARTRLHGFAQLTSNVVTVNGAGSFASVAALDGATIAAGAATAPTAGGLLRLSVVDSARIDSSYSTVVGTTVAFLSLASQISGVESGTATLVAGLTPLISAVLTATSRIVATYSNVNTSTALGVLSSTNQTPGTPGSFQITSLNLSKAVVTGDVSSVDWHVLKGGAKQFRKHFCRLFCSPFFVSSINRRSNCFARTLFHHNSIAPCLTTTKASPMMTTNNCHSTTRKNIVSILFTSLACCAPFAKGCPSGLDSWTSSKNLPSVCPFGATIWLSSTTCIFSA